MSDILNDAYKRLLALCHDMENSRSAVVSDLNQKLKKARIALEIETRKKDMELEEATMEKDRLTRELQELRAQLEERKWADRLNLKLVKRIRELDIILTHRHSDIETKAGEIRALEQKNDEASRSLAKARRVNDQLQACFTEQLGVNSQLQSQLKEANKRAANESILADEALCRAKEAERAWRRVDEVMSSSRVLNRIFQQRFMTRN